jgi:3',5'-cyclic-AMP phosphodiesterase
MKGDFAFAHISDSHIGFDKAANPDVTATLQQAIANINTLAAAPDSVLHSGDLTPLSNSSEFDTLDQSHKSRRRDRILFVPREHDFLDDNGERFRARYGKGTIGDGWQRFDHTGVHFIGLVNVMNLKAGGLGSLGVEQLTSLKQDLKHVKHSTPIVVFADILLRSVYPQCWGTGDSEQAVALLKEFGSAAAYFAPERSAPMIHFRSSSPRPVPMATSVWCIR